MLALILSGGTGTRLWPASRAMLPKQFLSFTDSKNSLLQDTLLRIASLVGAEDIFIVGSQAHELEITRQTKQVLPDFSEKNILLEPQSRNTAPAILWALTQIPENKKNQPIIILPSDHLIKNNDLFLKTIQNAAQLALENWIVTFGIKPDQPETGYGYIKAKTPLAIGFKVDKFVEKPNLAKAEEYLKSKEYSWNAGIFMATASSLIKEFKIYCPDLVEHFFTSSKDYLKIESIYKEIEPESFDYAVLEKSANVAVVTLDVGWNDLGSWKSIHEISSKDKNGNVIQGNVITQKTNDCMILANKRLVTGIGLKNLLIIDTDDALLVCDLSKAQDVKSLVDILKKEKREEFEFHTTVLRPWGSYTRLFSGPGFQIKQITILPGKRISLQRHFHRNEHWVILSGTAAVTKDKETKYLTRNESTYIPKTSIHRLSNPGKSSLVIIEVQQGSYLAEDDIERFEDDFGRVRN